MGLLRDAGDFLRHQYDLARLGMTTDQPRCLTPANFATIASHGEWKIRDFLAKINRRLVFCAAERAAGRETNTIINVGQRHGKSMFASEFTPAWWVGMFPNDQVMLTAYEANFAEEWGGKAKGHFEEFAPQLWGLELDPDRAAASRWGVKGHTGVMRTAGAGGSIIGKGAHLLIIDDPVKDFKEALSDYQRDQLWNWWVSTVRGRREPGCATIIIMQRWHEDDLVGRLIADMANGGDQWEVMQFKSLAEEGDPLGRRPGDALWPERYSREKLELSRKISPYWFAAQHQQDPRPKGGVVFKREWFDKKMVKQADVPGDAERCRYWDRAASLGKGDWTVSVRMARDANANYYVENVTRDQLGSWSRDLKIVAVTENDHVHFDNVRIRCEQEPGSSGKDAALAFRKMLDRWDVATAPVTGNKESRIRPFASACEGGNVYIVEDAWNEAFLDELEAYNPAGCKYDDQADAAGGVYGELSGRFKAEWGENPFADYRGSISLAG